jgi:hypothetical protein
LGKTSDFQTASKTRWKFLKPLIEHYLINSGKIDTCPFGQLIAFGQLTKKN